MPCVGLVSWSCLVLDCSLKARRCKCYDEAINEVFLFYQFRVNLQINWFTGIFFIEMGANEAYPLSVNA